MSGVPGDLNRLAMTAYREGRDADAVALFRQLIERSPGSAEYHNGLGTVLARQGALDDARRSFETAIRLAPDYAAAFYNLGNVLAAAKVYGEAIAAYEQSMRLDPNSAATFNNLGTAYLAVNRLDDAIEAYEQALELRADLTPATLSLGSLLRDTGQLDRAIRCYRRGLAQGQNPRVESGLLYSMLFDPKSDSAAIYKEHLRWDVQFAAPMLKDGLRHANEPVGSRRLRIGYVSADFRHHVVGYNLLPLLRGHDRNAFEVVCYSNVAVPDAMTDQFRALAEIWRDIRNLSDAQGADLIRQDGIDVLIDTALHMADHRLLVFARKPAPVQATFAGYPGTTGLSAMGYRLTDRFLDPPGQSDEGRYSERSVRLANSFWCFDTTEDQSPAVGETPQSRHGYLTFGCLSAFAKITEPTLEMWERVLSADGNSRMIILAPPGSARERVVKSLCGRTIDSRRIEFVERLPRRQYLDLYNRMDVFLDTFPYNGHSTSLDALWMGVPVVSLAGEQVVSRGGLSILSNLGLAELAALNPDRYVEIARDLAADLPRRSLLRSTLRQRMRESPLTDTAGFARDIEAAYRWMWTEWCDAQKKR